MIRPSGEPPEAQPSDAPPGEPAEDAGEGSGRYTVRLESFEGPLDLLLYLIQRDEMDIYDIPIAHITQQYLEYLELLDVFNLDNAGEFLVMAATLMRIKARLLLPAHRSEDEEDEADPREELVRRLLEYKKYKEAAGKLADAEDERRDFFYRGQSYPFTPEDSEPPELSLSLFDLLGAVRNVLDQLQGENVHRVYQEVFTVEEQSAKILDRLVSVDRIRFVEIFEGAQLRMEVVVTFVAMLELMKNQKLRARQLGPYDEIWLSRGDGPKEAHDAA